MDESKKIEIENCLVKCKQTLYQAIELINSLLHEEHKRDCNVRASKLYSDIQELQTFISSR